MPSEKKEKRWVQLEFDPAEHAELRFAAAKADLSITAFCYNAALEAARALVAPTTKATTVKGPKGRGTG